MLEVGCGHGVLADLLASRGGSVVAVDRSATMTAAAARRNSAAVGEGRVRLLTGPLVDLDLDEAFDVVVAFDVRALWTPPAPEWDVVDRVLAPGGRVVVAFSVMAPAHAEALPAAVGRLAAERGLAVVDVRRANTSPHPSVAVVLRRGAVHPAG